MFSRCESSLWKRGGEFKGRVKGGVCEGMNIIIGQENFDILPQISDDCNIKLIRL
jgi:hypothetical protein